jgi:hypothetical protein
MACFGGSNRVSKVLARLSEVVETILVKWVKAL